MNGIVQLWGNEISLRTMVGLDASVSGVLTISLAAVRYSRYSTCSLVNVFFAIDNFSFASYRPCTRTRWCPVPKPVSTGGDMSLVNFAVHAGLSAAFWLSYGCSGQRHDSTDKLNFVHVCSACSSFCRQAQKGAMFLALFCFARVSNARRNQMK
jgi:hypothetical protein